VKITVLIVTGNLGSSFMSFLVTSFNELVISRLTSNQGHTKRATRFFQHQNDIYTKKKSLK